MKPFTNFSSRMAPLAINNIDTDQIIPAEYLSYNPSDPSERKFFGKYAMSGVPIEQSGLPKGRIPFVDEGQFTSRFAVIIGGRNFGCGSSREHAPWALTQFGFRAVISTSFADIFKQNSLKNSLLPIVVPADAHAELFEAAAGNPDARVKVDLASQTLTLPSGRKVQFPVDEFSKHCLLDGVDELGYILAREPTIAQYEAGRVGSIDTLG